MRTSSRDGTRWKIGLIFTIGRHKIARIFLLFSLPRQQKKKKLFSCRTYASTNRPLRAVTAAEEDEGNLFFFFFNGSLFLFRITAATVAFRQQRRYTGRLTDQTRGPGICRSSGPVFVGRGGGTRALSQFTRRAGRCKAHYYNIGEPGV